MLERINCNLLRSDAGSIFRGKYSLKKEEKTWLRIIGDEGNVRNEADAFEWTEARGGPKYWSSSKQLSFISLAARLRSWGVELDGLVSVKAISCSFFSTFCPLDRLIVRLVWSRKTRSHSLRYPGHLSPWRLHCPHWGNCWSHCVVKMRLANLAGTKKVRN